MLDEEKDSGAEPVVVVPIEFSSSSPVVAEVGANVARHVDAKLIFCHAIFPKVIPFGPASPPWVLEVLRSEANRKMEPFLNVARKAGVLSRSEIEEGTPAGVILKVARRHAANLIVLATRRHRAWFRKLLWPTVTEQVTREADCNVIVVQTGAA